MPARSGELLLLWHGGSGREHVNMLIAKLVVAVLKPRWRWNLDLAIAASCCCWWCCVVAAAAAADSDCSCCQ